MSTLTLASKPTPTLQGYVHVFNKTTRKSQFLSPQPNAMLAEQQADYDQFIFTRKLSGKASALKAKLEALFH
jgi:hypothetical protein